MAHLLYEWNMVGSPVQFSCHNAQRAVVNLPRSYPSQLKRYQALTWWMEDNHERVIHSGKAEWHWQSPAWKLILRCLYCRGASLADDTRGFPCMKPSPLFPSTSHPVGKMKEIPRRQDAIMIWNSSSKIFCVFVLCYNKKLSARIFKLLLCGNSWNSSNIWDLQCEWGWGGITAYLALKFSPKYLKNK